LKKPVANNTNTSHSGLSKGGNPYSFRLVNKNKFTSSNKVRDYIYTFTNKHGYKYYANCIEYNIGVFAVKFHLAIHRKHPDRYKKIINQGDAIPVLKTIVGIMLDVLKQNELASFAFVGMPRHNEEIKSTTRYCVYREFCKKYFNPNSFDHFYDEEKSFYTLLNKKTDTNRVFKQVAALANEELKDEGVGLPSVSLSRATH